jgi:hypothetical protein
MQPDRTSRISFGASTHRDRAAAATVDTSAFDHVPIDLCHRHFRDDA